jgi:CheY-like chemotaxis protein
VAIVSRPLYFKISGRSEKTKLERKGQPMEKRILVVDDDRDMQALLQDLLASEAYEVDTAHDGLIALEKLVHRRERYELILLDLTMPRMNGLQLIQVLQQFCCRSCANGSTHSEIGTTEPGLS